jgi:hypothetical protein
MPDSKFEYRIWQRGSDWHWQVVLESKNVLASGVATTSVAARRAAMGYCLEQQDNHFER